MSSARSSYDTHVSSSSYDTHVSSSSYDTHVSSITGAFTLVRAPNSIASRSCFQLPFNAAECGVPETHTAPSGSFLAPHPPSLAPGVSFVYSGVHWRVCNRRASMSVYSGVHWRVCNRRASMQHIVVFIKWQNLVIYVLPKHSMWRCEWEPTSM